MKNKKLLAAIAVALLLALYFSGCGDDPSNDISIGQITIYNIPATIQVKDRPDLPKPDTFRVYLNASDSMNETDPPKAKGFVEVTPQMLQPNGTYTVTMQLKNPNPDFYEPHYDSNPNMETGPWMGTAWVFSIMISPKNTVLYGEDAVWAKGNYDLNKEKENWDWNNPMDFRNQLLREQLNLGPKLTALYNDIVCADPNVITE